MSLRTIQVVEKNVSATPPHPIVVAAATPIEIFPDVSNKFGELVSRTLQNVGANPCYYAIGCEASLVNYHGIISILQPYEHLTGQSLSVYSAGGTTIAVQILNRNEL